MASKHKQEDPWAGFVDVLSNILMVVIFLVVILGISIYAISQQVTKTAVEQALQQERSKSEKAKEEKPVESKQTTPAESQEVAAVQPKDTVQAEAAEKAATEAKPSEAAQEQTAADPKTEDEAKTADAAKSAEPAAGAADASVDKAQASQPEDTAKPVEKADVGAVGDRAVAHALRVRQKDDVAGNTNLSVRSAKSNGEEKIEVASEEIKPSYGPIKVDSSDAFLTLTFGKGSFRIDAKTSERIKDYLGKDQSQNGEPIEIRAFAQSTVGSVSEARRIAFYRAMQARTELMKSGYKPENISVKVRESSSNEELDAVRIYRKS